MERALIVALLLFGGVEPNPGLLTPSIPEGTWIEAALDIGGVEKLFIGRVNSPPGESRDVGFEFVVSGSSYARIRSQAHDDRRAHYTVDTAERAWCA